MSAATRSCEASTALSPRNILRQPSPEQVRAEAIVRIERALELIERAQHDLDSACAELSTIVGGIPVWRATSKMGDRVEALWYRVENFRKVGRFALDSTHIEVLARRLAQREGTRS
jgi:hypothetical protein